MARRDGKNKSSFGSKLLWGFLILTVTSSIDEDLAGIAITVYVIICVLAGIVKKSRESRPGRGNTVHSHDRLDPNIRMENGLEHYKIQLDGFLKAGIIDRNEYYTLLKKYSKQLNGK